jgi:hypothetical protein
MLTASEDKYEVWELILCAANQKLSTLDDSVFWRNAIRLRMKSDTLIVNVGHCLMWIHTDRIPVGESIVIAARPLGQPDATVLLKAERADSGLLMTHHGKIRDAH